MAAVYDRWMAADRVPYERWAEFIRHRLDAAARPVHDVVELCCGTGTNLGHLQRTGYRVTGVDASMPMLRAARGRLGPDPALVQLTLPDIRLRELGPFDAALCCFDGLNYLTDPGALDLVLTDLACALRPGAVVVFDLSTRVAFESVAALGEFREDMGEFSYRWRTHHEDGPGYRFEVTLEPAPAQDRPTGHELHHQRWFDTDEVAAALTGAGFGGIDTTDDYSDRPAGPSTHRQTWTARLRPRQERNPS